MAKRNSNYSSVVFSAYVCPTVPIVEQEVGDPNGPGYVGGRYVGLDDPREDIAARFQLLQDAAEQIYDLATTTRDDPTVLHVFCCPEFFFRGKTGAYSSSADHELLFYFRDLARAFADQPKFHNWLFFFGTILESDLATATATPAAKHQEKAAARDELVKAIVKAYDNADDPETKDFVFDLLTRATEFAQSHPLSVVRNFSYIYKPNAREWPDGVIVEKKFVSHEDFVISYYAPDAYSEMNVAYPYVDETCGEIKKEAYDYKSIFVVDGITFAVEICLDHRRARLRQVRNDDQTSNVPVDIHLVLSCGMQIQQPSVVARTGGLVFNCDGQYAANANPGDGTSMSIFTGSRDEKGHSQMTLVKEQALGKDTNAKLERPKDVTVVTAPLRVRSQLHAEKLQAYGAGEIHLYSKYALP